MFDSVVTACDNLRGISKDVFLLFGAVGLYERPFFAKGPALGIISSLAERVRANLSRDLLMRQAVVDALLLERRRDVLLATLSAWVMSPLLETKFLEETCDQFKSLS